MRQEKSSAPGRLAAHDLEHIEVPVLICCLKDKIDLLLLVWCLCVI